MTAIRDELERRYRPAVKREPPEGAFVVGAAGALILSVDSIAAAGKQPEVSGKRCDDLVVLAVSRGKTGIYAVERKEGRRVAPLHVQEQLQGGMDFVDDFIDHHAELRGQGFVFEPVLVYRNKAVTTRAFRRKLEGRTVTSRFSKTKAIVCLPWGEPLPPLKAA